MKVAIHGKKVIKENRDFIRNVIDDLKSRSCEIILSESFYRSLRKFNLAEDLPYYSEDKNLTGMDLMVSLGGDGTLLETVAHMGPSQVPVWGLNLGRMGFLATTARDMVQNSMEEIFSGKLHYEERTLLRLHSTDGLFGDKNFALNDFTILKKDTSSMILLHAYINGEFLNSYWADGIIVATPTGSTGYSLSCGGPLILPGSSTFVITPVSPHNLTARPMVVPDASIITFKVEGRAKQYLTSLDSRFKTIGIHTELTVEKADFKARLVKLKDSSYFGTIRQKLSWGLDYRN